MCLLKLNSNSIQNRTRILLIMNMKENEKIICYIKEERYSVMM